MPGRGVLIGHDARERNRMLPAVAATLTAASRPLEPQKHGRSRDATANLASTSTVARFCRISLSSTPHELERLAPELSRQRTGTVRSEAYVCAAALPVMRTCDVTVL